MTTRQTESRKPFFYVRSTSADQTALTVNGSRKTRNSRSDLIEADKTTANGTTSFPVSHKRDKRKSAEQAYILPAAAA